MPTALIVGMVGKFLKKRGVSLHTPRFFLVNTGALTAVRTMMSGGWLEGTLVDLQHLSSVGRLPPTLSASCTAVLAVPSSNLMTLKFLRSMIVALFDHDEDLADLDIGPFKTLYQNLESVSYNEKIAILKYITIYPMYRLMVHDPQCSPPPTLPTIPGHLNGNAWIFTGYLRKWFKNRFSSIGNRRTPPMRRLQLAWTIFQGVKRALEVVPESMVGLTYVNHMETLSKWPVFPPDDYESLCANIFCKFKSGNDFFTDLIRRHDWDFSQYDPSTRATYENRLSTGGGLFYTQLTQIDDPSDLETLDIRFEDDKTVSRGSMSEKIDPTQDLEFPIEYTLSGNPPSIGELISMDYSPRTGTSTFRGIDVPRRLAYIRGWNDIRSSRMIQLDEGEQYTRGPISSHGKVRVSAVLEPLKFD